MRYLFLLFLIPFMACAQTRTVTVKSDGTLVSGSANLFSANSNLLNSSVSFGSQNGNFVKSTNGNVFGNLRITQTDAIDQSIVIDHRNGITSISNLDVGPWIIFNPNGIWDLENGGETKVAWYYGTIVMPERLIVGNLIVTNGFTNTFGGDVAKVAVYADNSKALVASPTTSTELSYLVGLQGNLNTILTKTTNGSLAYVVNQSNSIIAYIVSAVANLGTNSTNNSNGRIANLNGSGTNTTLNNQTNIGLVIFGAGNGSIDTNAQGLFNDTRVTNLFQLRTGVNGDVTMDINENEFLYYNISSPTTLSIGNHFEVLKFRTYYSTDGIRLLHDQLEPDGRVDMSLGSFTNQWANIYGQNIFGTNFVPQNSTASRAAVIGSDGILTNSPVTTTEQGYLSGVTSALQPQIDSKGSLSALNITSNNVNSVQTSLTTASNALYLLQSAGISNGNALYVDAVNGNDSTGIRGRVDKPFTTINMAKTNALAGDTVIVLPGRYTNQTLSKVGINYYFYPGAVVTNLNLSIFTDGNVATTNIIAGSGDFHYYNSTFPSPDMVAISNSATRLTFKAHYVTCANNDGVSGQMSAFMVRNCGRVDLDIDVYYDHKIDDGAIESNCNCIFWYNGDMHANIRRCTTEFGYVAWSQGATDNLYYDGELARATLGPTFYNSGTNKMWMRVTEIRSDASIAVSGLGGNGSKMYVTAQKIIGNPAVLADSRTEIWVQSEKMSCIDGGGSWVQCFAGSRAYINCDHFEQEGAMTGPGFDLYGTGTNYIRAGVICATNIPLVRWSGSKTILDGAVLDMKAGTITNAPIWAMNTNGANSSLTLKNCLLISGGATNSIYATNAQTINAIGTVQITNANQNVSFNGTMVTSGGFSTIR